MRAARIRPARASACRASRLMLIVFVAACGGQEAVAQIAAPGGHRTIQHARQDHSPPRDLRFRRLTTDDGLSQNNVVAIVQDRHGFMWFGTAEGLNRYDGNSFVVPGNDPNDLPSISRGFVGAVAEDDRGYLWVGAYPGIAKFDPTTERSTRYLHDPNNSNSFSGDSVASITADRRGHVWVATLDSGLDRFDPATETFTHYRNDSAGQFVGWVRRVIEDAQGEIWFVGDRGLFHVNQQTGQVTRSATTMKALSAFDVHEDSNGEFWFLTSSPIVGLIRYNRQTKAFAEYPLGAGATLLNRNKLLTDGPNGFWVPSSLGLSYFDRRSERFTLFRHDRGDPDSLSDNSVVSIYRDRSGLLWVSTANGGVNILDLRQQRFRHYTYRPDRADSLSPGKATAIHEDSDGVLWVGVFPRGLDRVDRRTGRVTPYRPGTGDRNLSNGGELNTILKDTRGYLWLGGLAAGLDRFDQRTGRFKHYAHDPADSHSLMTDDVICVYEDRGGQLWVGQFGGVSRFDPVTEQFTNYRPGRDDAARLAYSVSAIHRDRSGTLWFGTWGGILSRFDEKTNTFVNYTSKPGDPGRLQGGSFGAIHEDRTGALWLGLGTGLYRFDPKAEVFTRYTRQHGLPSDDVMGILEDGAGKLWISSKKGLSRFDPQTKTFRNYDVSDSLLSNDFSRSCYQRRRDGEMLFCGSEGVTAFFPEDLRDNPYVPPVVISNFKIFNDPVPIGGEVLAKAVPYVESLTLSYQQNVFSFEFAALSYANSNKNRYRYKLETFDPDWSEVDSKQRLATYTNLDHGDYVFRVQGSNSDGVWNDKGVSLPILITPPWYRTGEFRAAAGGLFLAFLWAAYQVRMRQVRRAFEMTLDARVGERTRIARELHDTLLQSFHGLLLRFQTVSYLLPARPADAKQQLDGAIEQAAKAITEGRDAVQGLRASTVERNDLPVAIRTLCDELATDASANSPPAFRVGVEGQPRNLHPIARDETYKIAAEALRNAFRHGQAGRVEVEIRYDDDEFRLRVRDDGKGIDQEVLAAQGIGGHYGLRGMPERASAIGGTLTVWSEAGAGTEVELRLPAGAVYTAAGRPSWMSQLFRRDS